MNIQDLLSGDTKLEFGNKEQITVIDDYMEAQEEAEENKKIYLVTFAISGSAEIEIEAEDEDEAKELAKDEVDIHSLDDYDIDFIETRVMDK